MSSMNKEDCCICLELIEKDKFSLDCNHIYHLECIEKWVEMHLNCPYCRKRLSEFDELVLNVVIKKPETDFDFFPFTDFVEPEINDFHFSLYSSSLVEPEIDDFPPYSSFVEPEIDDFPPYSSFVQPEIENFSPYSHFDEFIFM